MKTRDLRELYAGLPIEKGLPPMGTGSVSLTTYKSLLEPPARTWTEGSRSPKSALRPNAWFERIRKDNARALSVCIKNPLECPFDDFKGLQEALEHPYMATADGMNFVEKLLSVREKTGRCVFDEWLIEGFFVQPAVWREPKGRRLFLTLLKGLKGRDWAQTQGMVLMLRTFVDKPYFWSQAPDEAAALVQQAWDMRKISDALSETLQKKILPVTAHAFPDEVLKKRIDSWEKLKSTLRKNYEGSSCVNWLREFRAISG